MNLDVLRNALANNFNLSNLILKASYVICIAVVFEFIAWWAGRRSGTTPLPVEPQHRPRRRAPSPRRRAAVAPAEKSAGRPAPGAAPGQADLTPDPVPAHSTGINMPVERAGTGPGVRSINHL